MLFAVIKSLSGRKEGEEAADEEVPLAEREDEELMLAYADGDVQAFDILVKRHERALFNFILRSTGRRDIAEELLQETFVRIIKSAPKYQKTAKFTTWAYTIARNLCIDRARKWKKRKEYSLDKHIGGDSDDGGATFLDNVVDEKAASGGVDLEKKLFLERLKEALEKLPEEQREVFVMREFSGLKFREIAEVLDIPVPTVKSRMRYALQDLRGHLAAYRDHSFDEEEQREMSGAE
ncbi:MAG: RNA polymerase sigma factor [Thermoanaerobaculia bacterium]|nr:RNA polymerase sigma factor [Thermoanaerobaculia bacterium]